jgi:ribosomal protein S12 methylthiotransferase
MPYSGLSYFLDPFGCAKNQVDAENMMAHLDKAGWESTPSAESADLIIINSCGFIESAKQESINTVIRWRKLYPNKKILLAGCLAQRYAKELAENLNEADGFFGTENIADIAQAAYKTVKGADTGLENITRLPAGKRPLLSLPGSAYVKISEGCNNRCSYCAIPLIRGGLVSRTIPDILDECRTLLSRGIAELCIIGQDIGSFGTDTAVTAYAAAKLPELLDAISMIEGQFWVRLLYIHPDHFPLPILDIMEKDARFLPYFDIPFQHASTKILSAMNRRGTAKEYLELLATIRSRLEHAVIRSTFLLGFPGETEEDFAALLDFQEKARLDWLGCFPWSREENTAAYFMKRRVAKKKAAARKRIIEERQIPITEENMNRFAGETLEVLLEEKFDSSDDETEETFWLGRLYCQAPDIDGATVIVGRMTDGKNPQTGSLVRCRVVTRRGFDLEARLF